MELTKHCKEVIKERDIQMSWITETIESPKKIETHTDKTKHYLRKIEEHGNRWLRVIVNHNKIVTVFFDRRLRRNKNEA